MNLQSFLLLFLFAMFLGIIVWAYRPKAKKNYEAEALRILEEKD